MLVLSRQRDETIMIGDDVEITVVDIRGDKVRLGITAPRRIQVHRKEVYDAIKRENERAAKLSPRDVSDLPDTGAAHDTTDPKAPDVSGSRPVKPSPDATPHVPEAERGDDQTLDDSQRSDRGNQSQ